MRYNINMRKIRLKQINANIFLNVEFVNDFIRDLYEMMIL